MLFQLPPGFSSVFPCAFASVLACRAFLVAFFLSFPSFVVRCSGVCGTLPHVPSPVCSGHRGLGVDYLEGVLRVLHTPVPGSPQGAGAGVGAGAAAAPAWQHVECALFLVTKVAPAATRFVRQSGAATMRSVLCYLRERVSTRQNTMDSLHY